MGLGLNLGLGFVIRIRVRGKVRARADLDTIQSVGYNPNCRYFLPGELFYLIQ